MSLCLLLLSLAPAYAGQTGSTDFPPPPRAQNSADAVTLYLELVVNGRATGKIVPVVRRYSRNFIAAETLRSLDLPVSGDELIAVDDLAGRPSQYDQTALKLEIFVPIDWLPQQAVAGAHRAPYVHAQATRGAIVNYDVFVARRAGAKPQISMSNEVRAFGGFGVISSTSAFLPQGGGFRRYDTTWRYSDEQRMVTLEAGDVVTRALGLASAARIGGIQISRDFTIRPDVITFPLPSISGSAELPSTLDLFINGNRTQADKLQPGPYVMDSLPYVSGAGQAVVVVTDIHGRQVQTTVPFYISNQLLRAGLTDFALSAGAMRRDYGFKDFGYGDWLASGAVRHGVTNTLTLEAQGIAGRGFQLVGGGATMRIGYLGIISGDLAHSRYQGRRGYKYSLGYSYQRGGFSLSAYRTHQTRDYDALPDLHPGIGPILPRHARTVTTVTTSISTYKLGSFGAGYIDMRNGASDRFRLANLSWTVPVAGRAALSLRGDYDLERRRWRAGINVTASFGRGSGTVNAGIDHRSDRKRSWRAGFSRAAPIGGGIGGNLAYEGGDRDPSLVHADLIWRNPVTQLRAGVGGEPRRLNLWAGASGSIGVLGGHAFVSNRIADAFALVETSGVAGVEILYENQLVGRTGKRGALLVPWASSNAAAKYELNMLTLPSNIQSKVTERRLRVLRGAGHLVRFPLDRVVAASFTLRDASGADLPLGSMILRDGETAGYVGFGGFTYLEGLSAVTQLRVITPDGRRCGLSIKVDPAADQVAQLGAQTCVAET